MVFVIVFVVNNEEVNQSLKVDSGIMLFVVKNREINSSVTLVDCCKRETIKRGLQRVRCNHGSVMVVICHCLRTRDF